MMFGILYNVLLIIQSSVLIRVHYCIIFHFHIMLYMKKNKIFIAFFSLFSGPPLMEMKAHNQGIFKELMGLIKKPKEKVQKRSPGLESSTNIPNFLEGPARHTDRNRMATEIVGATTKILSRKRDSGRGSAASIWPLS